MVQISSTTNSVIFTFDGNQHYLSNGTIEVPKDSLALVVDDSDMVTFKKADSNDIFLSITLDELGMTKNEIISFYQSDMTGGGGGMTPEEVEEMIDEATSGKADTTALTSHTSDATIHVTASDKTAWNGKQDALVSGTNIKTVNNQSLLGSGDIEIQGGMTPAQEETIATALNELYDGIDEVSGNVGTLSGQVTANTSSISTVSGNVQTLATTVSGIQTNLGGIKFVALTQAQYDALAVKDANTLYIIND